MSGPTTPGPEESSTPWGVLWQAASRVGLFAVGAALVFLPDGSDVQVTAGAGLMLASAGIAIAKGLK